MIICKDIGSPCAHMYAGGRQLVVAEEYARSQHSA